MTRHLFRQSSWKWLAPGRGKALAPEGRGGGLGSTEAPPPAPGGRGGACHGGRGLTAFSLNSCSPALGVMSSCVISVFARLPCAPTWSRPARMRAVCRGILWNERTALELDWHLLPKALEAA